MFLSKTVAHILLIMESSQNQAVPHSAVSAVQSTLLATTLKPETVKFIWTKQVFAKLKKKNVGIFSNVFKTSSPKIF